MRFTEKAIGISPTGGEKANAPAEIMVQYEAGGFFYERKERKYGCPEPKGSDGHP